jgi:hypothetical protein
MSDISLLRKALLEGPDELPSNLGHSIILTQRAIPFELRSLPRWLVWRWVRIGGRWRKLPQRLTPSGLVDGFSSSRDAASLSCVPELLPLLDQSCNRGLMFSPGLQDGRNWIALDVDDFHTGQLDRLPAPLAQLHSARAGYWCPSPSGLGVRVIGHTGSICLKTVGLGIEGCRVQLLPETATVTTVPLLAGSPLTLDLRPQILSLAGDRASGRESCLPGAAPLPAASLDSSGLGRLLLTAARSYLAKLPDAVEGQGGGKAFYKVCAVIACQFGLNGPDGEALAREWNNSRCLPPFNEVEFQSKWAHAVQRSLSSTPSFANNLAGAIGSKSALRDTRKCPPAAEASPFGDWWP